MGWEIGQEIIDRLRCKKRTYGHSVTAHHAKYGKIYYPNYNLDFEFRNKDLRQYYDGDTSLYKECDLNLYNEYGEKLDVFFLRDNVFAHMPYRISRHFMFDRYNFGLKTHFYANNCIMEMMGNPDKRYAMLVESESIAKSAHNLFFKHKGLNNDFDLIFTHSARILDSFENARFVPFCASIWSYSEVSDNNCFNKTKNVSILSSDKLMCPMHKYRYDLAYRCKNEGLADTFGTFDGGPIVKFADTLKDYMYSICIENEIQPYFFTERLLTAMAFHTVPIYLGATDIDRFFNPDGIIKISTKDDIKEVLKQCSKEDYESRLPAIKDNYNRALEYAIPMDYMYRKYIK